MASSSNQSSGIKAKYAEPPKSKFRSSRLHDKDTTELFRKDLISAMRMRYSENLTPNNYWLIQDRWRPQWEKGVQVPAHPDVLPEVKVKILGKNRMETNFKLPEKLICCTRDSSFNRKIHVMSYTDKLAKQTCRYDMNDLDEQWLNLVNEDRGNFGQPPIEEAVVEQIIEKLEVQSYVNFQKAIKNKAAICDVCRSPDFQEGNELVFCDTCNICVHQICYGIATIPEGSWICQTCAVGIQPACVLCPNRGGAMKTTSYGQKWAHVSCAIWIPEVSLNFNKTEPIIKISLIPQSRRELVCTICKNKVGACIQCSEKNCENAFHVTCAFQEGLQMQASVNILSNHKLHAFCAQHSKKKRTNFSDSDQETASAETSLEHERENQRRIQAMEAKFYNYVNIDHLSQHDRTQRKIIFNYWKLKRSANFNRPLLPPKIDNYMTEAEAYKRLIDLRRNLEKRRQANAKLLVFSVRRSIASFCFNLQLTKKAKSAFETGFAVRNLCYMVKQRERCTRDLLIARKDIFDKQVDILTKFPSDLSKEEKEAVLNANKGSLTYDKEHAGINGPSPNVINVLTNLVGEDFVKTHFSGAMRHNRKSDKSETTPNPYTSVDKKVVSGLQNSLDAKLNANFSFQSSSNHIVSDDGSSKDSHDLNLDQI